MFRKISSVRIVFLALVFIFSLSQFSLQQVSAFPAASNRDNVGRQGGVQFPRDEGTEDGDDGWDWKIYLYIALGVFFGLIILSCLIGYLFCECVKTIICCPFKCLCCCCD